MQQYTYAAYLCHYSDEPTVTIAEQDDDIRAEASTRGVDIIKTFSDLNVQTHTSEARPGLLAAIDAARRGEITAPIIATPDRISRDLECRGHINQVELKVSNCYGRILYLGHVAVPALKAHA